MSTTLDRRRSCENTEPNNNSVATAIVAVALGLVRTVKSYNFVATLYLLSSLSLVFSSEVTCYRLRVTGYNPSESSYS